MRAMVPSSFITSQITAAGLSPASFARSTLPSSLSGAFENTAGTGAQGEDVSGHDKVFGTAVLTDRGTDRCGSVSSGNAGGHAFTRLNGDSEVRAKL